GGERIPRHAAPPACAPARRQENPSTRAPPPDRGTAAASGSLNTLRRRPPARPRGGERIPQHAAPPPDRGTAAASESLDTLCRARPRESPRRRANAEPLPGSLPAHLRALAPGRPRTHDTAFLASARNGPSASFRARCGRLEPPP